MEVYNAAITLGRKNHAKMFRRAGSVGIYTATSADSGRQAVETGLAEPSAR